MSGALNFAEAIVGTLAMFAFWFVVWIVIPGVFAIYVAGLLPLTGQWRKRWTARRSKRRG